MPGPIHNLPIRIMRLLGTKRRPPNQALKHNRPHTPPITSKIVSFSAEDLGRDVVRCADGRVCKLAPRLAPRVDLVAIGDGELDLVDGDGIAVLADGFGAGLGHELLVVGGRVFFGEAGGEAEVG